MIVKECFNPKCGKLFQTTYSSKKYCSRECFAENNRRITLRCSFCQNNFLVLVTDKEKKRKYWYCSNKCVFAAKEDKRFHPQRVVIKKRKKKILTEEEKLKQFEARLRTHYGITIDQYNQMWKDQGGKCYGCSEDLKPGITMAIDHDHVTGKVRGLACRYCNHFRIPAVERYMRDPHFHKIYAVLLSFEL